MKTTQEQRQEMHKSILLFSCWVVTYTNLYCSLFSGQQTQIYIALQLLH